MRMLPLLGRLFARRDPQETSFPKRALAEAMEARILHSADLAPLLLGASAHDMQPVHTITPAVAQTARAEIAFIDADLLDADELRADLLAQQAAGRPIEVVTIALGQDGIALITKTLADRHDISAVHVLAHGSDGQMQLGSSQLNAQSLLANAGKIAGWSNALAPDADLLLYGCDLAQTSVGLQLVQDLAVLTGADVAASTDLTGAAARGGDWVLEVRTGSIEAALAPSMAEQAQWHGVMAPTTYTADISKADGAAGSLRDVISQANTNGNAEGSIIQLQAGTYTIALPGFGTPPNASGDLDVLTTISFVGASSDPSATIIDANSIDRAFELWGGNVSFRDLTIQGGSGVAQGGGIFVRSGVTATLTNVVLSGNTATQSGGAVYNAGIFSAVNTLFSTNSTTNADWNHGGGALFNIGTATLTDSWVDSNTAVSVAGGLNTQGAGSSLTLTRVTVSNNISTAASGGGIYFNGTLGGAGAPGTLLITNSTISNNTANSSGGGLRIVSLGATVLSSTIAYNHSVNAEGNALASGGITCGPAGLASTGGITVSIGNSILASNTVMGFGAGNSNTQQISLGFNIDTDGSAGFNQVTDLQPLSADVHLALTLAANGGFGKTLELLTGSVAINAGDSSAPATDQRGVSRDGLADIGAYEDQPPIITSNGGGPSASINVAENSTAITTVTATDADLGATLAYSIAGGVDAGLFMIDGTTGALRFLVARNHEQPVDDGPNNVYDVTVSVTDGSLTDTQMIAVSITNDNDNAVSAVTDSNAGDNTLAENASVGTSVGLTAFATDADSGGPTISYSLSSNPGTFFAIDASTGVVRLARLLNFESATGHDITVLATSSDGSTNSAMFGIAVTNVNEAPTFGALGTGSVTVEPGSAGHDFGNAVAVQADGKILVAGSAMDETAFGLVRYNPNGVLDTTFSADGKVTTSIGTAAKGNAVVVQADGKIVVGGEAPIGGQSKFALVRYNTDGSLDATFGSGGTVTTVAGPLYSYILGLALQADGKIVAVGFGLQAGNDTNDAAIARYNTDGSLDTTFSGDGTLLVDWGFTEMATAVAIQADGKLVVVGEAGDGSQNDFGVTRLNPDGSFDTTFSGDGLQKTSFGGGNDQAKSVVIQADGKILLAGYGSSGSSLALARYNTDGTPDMGFDGDGALTTAGLSSARSVALQADGKIVVGGVARNGAAADAFAVARYNADGSLDTTFSGDGIQTTVVGTNSVGKGLVIQTDGQIVLAGYANSGTDNDFALARYGSDGTLDISLGDMGSPTYTENGAAVVLDSNVHLVDVDLTASHYAGATLTLIRNGVASSQDVFGHSGVLGALIEGGNLVISGTTVGTVTTNSGGTLLLTFNASATQARVNAALQAVTYANSSDTPPTSVQINWIFYDGNTGAQGTGGALTASGSTTVAITAVNDEQLIATNTGTTVAEGSTGTVISAAMLTTSDGDNTTAEVTYTVTSVPVNGALKWSGVALGVSNTFTQAGIASGLLTYDHSGSESTSDSFGFSVDDGAGPASTGTFNITVTAINDNNPVITSNGGAPTASINAAENSAAVTTVTATDGDEGAGATQAYSITGVDAAFFSIDVSTGALTFQAAPNYELAADAGGDNVYDVTVQVSDGTLTDTQAIAVTVTNVNDAPMLVNGITDQLAAAGTPFSLTLVGNEFTDADAGDTLQCAATLSTGAALPSWLHFNGATGTFSGTPAFTDKGSFTVRVTATDSNELSAQTTFAMTVSVPNVAPPVPVPDVSDPTPEDPDPVPPDAPAVDSSTGPSPAPVAPVAAPLLEPAAAAAVAAAALGAAAEHAFVVGLTAPRSHVEVQTPVYRNQFTQFDVAWGNAVVQQFTFLSSTPLVHLLRGDDLARKFQEIEARLNESSERQHRVMASRAVLSGSLTIGYVVWIIRGGVFASSMLSALPAWQMIDPLPVVTASRRPGRKIGDEHDESEIEHLFDDAHGADEADDVVDQTNDAPAVKPTAVSDAANSVKEFQP